MLEYIKYSVVLLFVISAAVGENCVTYDFGANFYNTFNHEAAICNEMASWNLNKYSESNVESPHSDSDLFISPGETLSCVTSYSFEMRSTGILEVHVYMESASLKDQVVILAQEINPDGSDAVTGSFMLTPHNVNYEDGWQVLRINLTGTGNFDGYVTFLGLATPGATVIVDSFRYIPPAYEENCFLYGEDFVLPTVAPQIGPESTSCVTYDFEENFEETFNSDRGLCTGLAEWGLGTFDAIPVDKPISDSYQFIWPQIHISCISSFPFDIEAGGILEVNVYMESQSDSDQVAVLASQILDENNDAVTGSVVLTPLRDDYSDGWHILRIDLTGDKAYKGYISFLGMASEESIVLIDSLRYIPPQLEEEGCPIYGGNLFETTTPTPITAPNPTGESCITYNFETEFSDYFDTSNQLCNGYSDWHLGNYYSLSIETIFPDSSTFISPNVSSSCISSFIFDMKPQGYVEVNVFMKSASELDFVVILAKKVVPGGLDTVAGFQLYYATNADFVEGWNVLKVSVIDFLPFNGYITIIGSMSEESIVLIDSFRYIPPNYEEPCSIY